MHRVRTKGTVQVGPLVAELYTACPGGKPAVQDEFKRAGGMPEWFTSIGLLFDWGSQPGCETLRLAGAEAPSTDSGRLYGGGGGGGSRVWANIAASQGSASSGYEAAPPVERAGGRDALGGKDESGAAWRRLRRRKAAERLGELTGATVDDCLDALEEANGDVNDAAAALLMRPGAATTTHDEERRTEAREAAARAAEAATAERAVAEREAAESAALASALERSLHDAATETEARAAAAREERERAAAAKVAEAQLAADLTSALAARRAEDARLEGQRQLMQAEQAAVQLVASPPDYASADMPAEMPAPAVPTRPTPAAVATFVDLAAIDAAIEKHLAARTGATERGRGSGRGGRGRGRLGAGRGFAPAATALDTPSSATAVVRAQTPPLVAAPSSVSPTALAPFDPHAEAKECVVCAESVRTHCLIPCGHFALCDACVDSIEATKAFRAASGRALPCPLCGDPTTSTMRLYT